MGLYEDAVGVLQSVEQMMATEKAITKDKYRIDVQITQINFSKIGTDGRAASPVSFIGPVARVYFSMAIDELFPKVLERAMALAMKTYEVKRAALHDEYTAKAGSVDQVFERVSKAMLPEETEAESQT
jgi:hypothetical protein